MGDVNRRPSPKLMKAKRAEVERRYKWAEQKRRELRSGGKHHPRRYWDLLKLFRSRGLGDEMAKAKIDEFGDLLAWSAETMGQAIEPPLTFAEKVELDIRTIQCADRSPEFVAAFYADLRRERDRLHKRQTRAAAPKRKRLSSQQAEVIRGRLKPRELRSELVERLAEETAFRSRSGGPLQPDALLQRVRRALKELAAIGVVRLEDGRNEHGQPVVIVVMP